MTCGCSSPPAHVRIGRAGRSVAGLAAVSALLHAAPAAPQERIRSYDIEIDVRPDGSLDVVERIRVRAEGSQIRRGIYRTFPTRYTDRYGNRVRVGFDVVGVERNGQPEAWFTERASNGVRLNTGGDDLLPVLPSEYTFTLRYRTTRQLGFFATHDELYWNAIGTDWVFEIEGGSVLVRLPEPVPLERMTAEGYTGPQGATGTEYAADLVAPGVARYRLTAPLERREGLTIVLTFPKGIVAEPSGRQRAGWFLSDNRGVIVGLLGLLALLAFCTREWVRVGRDPRKGVVIPRYVAREGFTAASYRYLRRMGYDTRCFSSDVLSLAVAGKLRIHRQDRFLLGDVWRLERERSATEVEVRGSQSVLLGGLFGGARETLTLKKSNAQTLAAAQTAHKKALDRELHPRYFKRNGLSLALAGGIAAVTGVGAFLVSGGYGIRAVVLLTGVMGGVVLVFSRLVRAPTPEGRRLLDEIEGLVLYLSVAERDELAGLTGPDGPPALDAERYEALLPYAVALEVEDAWTDKFTAAVGSAEAAATASRMSWYSGRGSISDMGSFSKAMGSGLSSQISAASSPPGSSSGSGGGGSSGGGGGGGGGGGR